MTEITRDMLKTFSLQAVLQIALANASVAKNKEVVAGLPRERWRQFDRERDYWE